MSIRKLPAEGTPELDRVIERYKNGEVETLWRELKFANRDSFITNMRKRCGVSYSEPSTEPVEQSEPERIITPAPEIKIKPIKQEGRRGEGREVHLQLISDAHCGLVTPTYNIVGFRARLEYLKKTIINICLLHRKMRPIRKLVIAFLGDMPQGEQYGVQGYVEEFEVGVVQQIYDNLVPEFTNFFVNLLQLYPEIEVYGVEGNHGNVQRRSQTMSKRSNWDIVFYRALKEALSNYARISFHTQEVGGEWYQVIEVNGWRFLLAHGDQVISYQGVPFYGLERKGLRWKQSIGVEQPFDFMLTGHVHNPNFLWNAGVPCYINGCFVTDSKFPLNRMALKDVPQQWSLFVNEKYGVTATYRIDLSKER